MKPLDEGMDGTQMTYYRHRYIDQMFPKCTEEAGWELLPGAGGEEILKDPLH